MRVRYTGQGAMVTSRRVKQGERHINGRVRLLAHGIDVFPSWSRTEYGESYSIAIRTRDDEGDVTEYVVFHLSRDLAKNVAAFWNEKLAEKNP